MTDFILMLLESINGDLTSLSASNALTGTMDSFSGSLYGYITSIQTNVALPIAYVVLSLFCVLALYDAAVKSEGSGSTTMGVEIVVHLLTKLSLCIWAIDNCPTILNAIYDVSTSFTSQASHYFSSASLSGLDIDALKDIIDNLDFWSKFGAMIIMLLTWLIMKFAMLMAKIIVITRFIELYLYFCVAPVPIAALPSPELSQIGKGFLKSFAAVCIQGTLIFLVLSFFPYIAGTVLSGSSDFLAIAAGLIGYGVVLIIAVFSTSKWAKSICNAM